MANLSFYCSVDFCSCEVTMTIDNQLSYATMTFHIAMMRMFKTSI